MYLFSMTPADAYILLRRLRKLSPSLLLLEFAGSPQMAPHEDNRARLGNTRRGRRANIDRLIRD